MGLVATYVDADTFTVVGDKTTNFVVDRALRCNCGVDGYKRVFVSSSSYSDPNTTIDLSANSDDLTANLASVEWSIVEPGATGNIPGDRVVGVIAKYYMHDQRWQRKLGDNSVIQSPNEISLDISGSSYHLGSQTELDVDTAGHWDTTVPTDYTVAATRAGKDFYVYAVQPGSGTTPSFLLSANSTTPSGYTSDNSRKMGGFHCLCVAAGTISDHDLTGYLQGDVLPASVWDLFYRPQCSPEGMVFSEKAGVWVDIYLQSGTGASTASANGATITNTRTWMDHVDDFAAVKKQLLSDAEFQIIAAGSPEEAQIWDTADPVTTGGHSAYFLLTLDVGPAVDWAADDTITGNTSGYTCTVIEKLTNTTYICKNMSNAAGFTGGEELTNGVNAADQGAGYPTWAASKGRMISNIGCEDCAGAMHQWLLDQSWRADGLPDTGDPTWDWEDLPGAKGSLYQQGTYGDVKLLAGLSWAAGARCGSRARDAYFWRWRASPAIGGRGRAEPRVSRFY